MPIRLVALFICSCIWADLTDCRKDSIFSFFHTILFKKNPLLLFVTPKAFFGYSFFNSFCIDVSFLWPADTSAFFFDAVTH